MLVLSATVIPVEFRPLHLATADFSIHLSDVVANLFDVVVNIAGFVPVGIVLGVLGFSRAVIAAALLSAFAETCQLVMVHRDPSALDVASNVIGGIIGAFISAHWRILSPVLRINGRKALVAVSLAFALVLGVWATSGAALNSRGTTSPGTIEAYWTLDESGGRIALDSSGHGLHGRFSKEPRRLAGVLGGAVNLDGAKDYIDFGHPSALRLTGSMTISAWINSSSFPADDAAIVSQLQSGFGYQLDTTVDRGPRTIGFKLTNSCGNLMARYGATPLAAGVWYHVAGVYDAGAQTLDVYLNGQLDNGFLLGPVTPAQHSSRADVYVGRRSDLENFQFAGSIDDVRVYSLALAKNEIAVDMRGGVINRLTVESDSGKNVRRDRGAAHPRDPNALCTVVSEPEDAKIPVEAALLGVLVAVACVGFWPSSVPVLFLVMSFAAGLLLLPAASSTLPAWTLCMIPLISLAGGASVAFSCQTGPDR